MAEGKIQTWSKIIDEGWKNLTLSSEMESGNIRYRKLGALVEIQIEAVKFKNNITDSNSHILATLPTDYRPNTYNHYYYLFADTYVPWSMSVRASNGTIACWKPSATATWDKSIGLYGTCLFTSS